MDRTALRAFLALSLCEGIGSRRLLSLVKYFGNSEEALHAPRQRIESIPGFGKETASTLHSNRAKLIEAADRELERLSEPYSLITYYDEQYPIALKNIYSPPALLYAAGNTEILTRERMVAVIGTRKATEYGKRWTRALAEGLARAHAVVVSGFASGIDTVAHHAAIDAGGATIGVLGSGVDVIYPTSNKNFAQELVRSGDGVLISELPFGTKPDARNFPWRNRIVSGLAQATVVVESDEKGGSMITASMALDESREIYAVPGDLEKPTSKGPNLLIREARAKLVRSAEDLVADLGWSSQTTTRKRDPIARTSLNLFENKIVDVLEAAGGVVHVDALAENAGLEVPELLVHLLGLEFKGIVQQLAGKQFTLAR